MAKRNKAKSAKDAARKKARATASAIAASRAQPQAKARRSAPVSPKGESADELQDRVGYHPARAPKAADWLALDEDERAKRIGNFHQTLSADRMPPNLDKHVALHLIVESQIAAADPAEVGPAVRRLQNGRMSRHDAVHAVGWLMLEFMKMAGGDPRKLDKPWYQRELADLDHTRWLRLMTGKATLAR